MFRLHAPLICRLLSVVRCDTLLFPVRAFCPIRLMPGARPGIGVEESIRRMPGIVKWGQTPTNTCAHPCVREYPTPVSVYRSLSMESR